MLMNPLCECDFNWFQVKCVYSHIVLPVVLLYLLLHAVVDTNWPLRNSASNPLTGCRISRKGSQE